MEIQLKSEIEVKLIQKMGGDSMVCAAAKVSTSGEDALLLVDEEANFGLINYLMKHRHGTPFEHASLTFFVHAPIFVWREWHRHRVGFSYNEESGRYKQLNPVFWIPKRERKLIPEPGYKSARPKFVEAPLEVYENLVFNLEKSYEASYEKYSYLLTQDIAKEVARAVLPVAIFSSCWVTTNPRALMHFLSLRTHEPEGARFISYPQAEIEQAARGCEEILKEGWPLVYKAWVENGRVAP